MTRVDNQEDGMVHGRILLSLSHKRRIFRPILIGMIPIFTRLFHTGTAARLALLPLFLLSQWTVVGAREESGNVPVGREQVAQQELYLPCILETRGKFSPEKPVVRALCTPSVAAPVSNRSPEELSIPQHEYVLRFMQHLLYSQTVTSGL